MINEVFVKNWKCHVEKTCDFKLGLNYLVGPNGGGKSSILEAIGVALTGNHPFGDVRNCVRKGADNAKISLRLDFEGEELKVERIISTHRREKSILTYRDQKWEGWNEVTQQVENILDIPSKFIDRIILLTEGEVHRTLNDPPKEILNLQVKRVFGLEQLENSLQVLESMVSLNQKSINDRRSIQRQLTGFRDLTPKQLETEISELRKKEEKFNKSKQALTNKLEGSNKKLSDSTSIRIEMERSIGIVKEFYKELGLKENKETAVNEIFDRQKDNISKKKKQIENNYRKMEKEWNKLKVKISWIDQITSDMSVEKRGKITFCPTCGKPLSFKDRQKIIKQHAKERNSLSEKEIELGRNCSQIQSEFEQYKNQLETILKWEKIIQNDKYIGKQKLSLGRLSSMYDEIEKEEEKVKKEQSKLSEEIRIINENEKNSALKIKEREGILENVKRFKAVSLELVRDYHKEALLDVLSYSFGQTLGVFRSTFLQPLFELLSHAWGKFVPFENTQVILSESGDLVIKLDGYELGYEHLSGGEKTVLLLLSRLLLMRQLTKLGFMLVDEPLEHLDVVYRRSIVKFLRDYCESEKDFQIIVSTYEENLIREDIQSNLAKGIFITEGRP